MMSLLTSSLTPDVFVRHKSYPSPARRFIAPFVEEVNDLEQEIMQAWKIRLISDLQKNDVQALRRLQPQSSLNASTLQFDVTGFNLLKSATQSQRDRLILLHSFLDTSAYLEEEILTSFYVFHSTSPATSNSSTYNYTLFSNYSLGHGRVAIANLQILIALMYDDSLIKDHCESLKNISLLVDETIDDIDAIVEETGLTYIMHPSFTTHGIYYRHFDQMITNAWHRYAQKFIKITKHSEPVRPLKQDGVVVTSRPPFSPKSNLSTQ